MRIGNCDVCRKHSSHEVSGLGRVVYPRFFAWEAGRGQATLPDHEFIALERFNKEFVAARPN
jgi:hypothetical protein